MGVPSSATAGQPGSLGRLIVPVSQRGMIALSGASNTGTGAVPAVSRERRATMPAATPPCAASPSHPTTPNLLRTGGVGRYLHSFTGPARKARASRTRRAAR
jgi:hypothetical protein